MPTVNLTARFIDSLKTPTKRTEWFDESVPGLCLRITETGHKSWGLYYRFAGRQQRLSLGNFIALPMTLKSGKHWKPGHAACTSLFQACAK